jgi:hypothetical protein
MPSNLSRITLAMATFVVVDQPFARAREPSPPEPRLPPLLYNTEIGPDLRRCAADAGARGEFGDVLVEIAQGAVVRLTASKRVGRETSRCVRSAVDRLLENERRAPRGQVDLGGQVSDVQIGTARPLLPALNVLLPAWRRYLVAGPHDVDAAGRSLRAILPPDAAVRSDRCLGADVDGVVIGESISQWLASIGGEVPGIWRFLFDDRLAPDSAAPPAFLVSGTIVLRALSAPTRLCLTDIGGAEARRHLRQRMEELGSCWVGDLNQILMTPEVAFPADRPFKEVAVSPDGATTCGLDLDGHPFCCGRNASKYPAPLRSFKTLSLSGGGARAFGACGVRASAQQASDGALECWGDVPPPRASAPLRTFVRQSLCGVTRAGQIACPSGAEVPLPEGAKGRVREASWAGSLICAVSEGGRMACSNAGTTRTFEGRFTDLDVGAAGLCATDSAAHPHCWDAQALSPRPTALAQIRLHGIVVTAGSKASVCGIGADGRVQCAPLTPGKGVLAPTDERFTQIAEGAGNLCGVTTGGRIQCWGDSWPPIVRAYESRAAYGGLNPH